MKSNNKVHSLIVSAIIFSAVVATGCKKSVEVNVPFTSFNAENVFTTDATAISASTSVYARMSSYSTSSGLGLQSISFVAGLSADELTLFPPSPNLTGVALFQNALTVATAPGLWNAFYQSIYQINSAIEGLSRSNSLTDIVKTQLIGEMKFSRALYYFYLTSLYGDVPLALTTDYKLNALMGRAPADLVRQQIIEDLLDAKSKLNSYYVGRDVTNNTGEKVRPNKWTAAALLARMYLYNNDYLNAKLQSDEIINSGLYALTTLNGAFLKNNTEAIWQLQPVNTGWNTEDARLFILPTTGPNTSNFPVYINKRLQLSFEPGDQRKISWLDSTTIGTDTFYYAHKYKSATQNSSVTEYNTVFRLAEIYLIRAESELFQNDLPSAIGDLDRIRQRAGLPLLAATNPSISKQQLIDILERERRSELFTEWGHRWLDLKRTGRVDAVMAIESKLKGGSWEHTDRLYPIGLNELVYNPNLTQTPGY